MSKNLVALTARDIRCIHWRKYITRKIVILTVCAAGGFIAEHYLKIWWLGKGGELLFGSVFEHIAFEVPLLEKSAEKAVEEL